MGERSTNLLPRIGWAAVVTAAALIPVAYTRALADPFSLPKATIWWLAAILAAVGLVAAGIARRGSPVPRLRILVPLGVLVGWTAIATLSSPERFVSLLGQYGRHDGFASLVAGVVITLAVVGFGRGAPERLVALAWAVFAGGAVSLVVVLGQGLGWAWTGWGTSDQGAHAIVGLAGNANFSGAMLALVVPVALGLREVVHRRELRWVLVAAAVALSGGVWWTATRAGLLAIAAGVAAFGLLAPDLLPRAVRFGAVAALAGGIVLIGATSATERIPGVAAVGNETVLGGSSLRERQNLWAGAIEMVEGSPLVGVGPDAFALRFPEVRSSRVDGRALIAADEAHNVFLDRAATAGLPALVAYAWLVVTVGLVAWRGRTRCRPEHRWLLGAFGGAFAGYLVQGFFSIDMVPLAALSWLCVGVLTVLTDPAAVGGEDPLPDDRPLPVAASVGLAVVAVLAIAVAVRPAMADRQARSGEGAEARGEHLAAYGRFAAASSWVGPEPQYRRLQAEALVAAASSAGTDPELRATLLDEALLAYDQALARAPGDVPLRLGRAQTHLLAAAAAEDPAVAADQIGSALGAYRDVMRDVRADDEVHLGLARALEARAALESGPAAKRYRDEAIAQYEAARPYRPDRRAATLALARLGAEDGDLIPARDLLVQVREEIGPDAQLDAAIEDLDRRIEAAG